MRIFDVNKITVIVEFKILQNLFAKIFILNF